MLGAAWMRILLAIAVAACLGALPTPATAQFHVAQPEVVKGQGEIADHGALYAGPGTVEKLDQAHQLELYYGLTDRLAFLTVGLLQQKIGENLEGETYDIGGQYQLLKPDGEGFALAIRSLYELSLQDGSPDQLLLGPIAKIVGHNAGATLDTFFVHDLDSSDVTALNTKWQVKHRLSDRMSFGVEGYGKIADLERSRQLRGSGASRRPGDLSQIRTMDTARVPRRRGRRRGEDLGRCVRRAVRAHRGHLRHRAQVQSVRACFDGLLSPSRGVIAGLVPAIHIRWRRHFSPKTVHAPRLLDARLRGHDKLGALGNP